MIFFFQAEDGIRDYNVTGVQTCALPISKPTLMLVDGFGLIFRAYYALDKSVSTMTTSSGEPTGAVYGFALMLLDLLRTQKPDYLVVALEGGRTFRHEAFDEYKANRAEMPDDFSRQVGRVRE